MSDIVPAQQLRSFVERIERVEAEIKELNSDKSEVYKELRGCGFDVKAVRQCVSARKLDGAEREERNAIFDLYWAALTGPSSRVHVHEASFTAAPGVAAEATGNDLREQAAAASGQIIREGDAPRETDCQAGEQSQGGGVASSLDTESRSPEIASLVQATADDELPQATSSATIPDADIPAFLKEEPRKGIADYRPHCLNPDACAGSGLSHCYACRRALELAQTEAA